MIISSISAERVRSGRWIRAMFGWAAALVLLASVRMIVRADSTGQVTGTTVNVRQSASVNSEAIASVQRGQQVTIKSQTTGTDGNVWYEIVVNGTTTGYIRGDFVEITDGSTPDTSTAPTTTVTPTTTTTAANTNGMTAYNPVSAKVSGGQNVRVRSDATTNSEILATLASGQELTVTGSKSLTDGFTWYYVTFTKDGQSMSGYIRDTYITLSGDLVEAGSGGETTTPDEPTTDEPTDTPSEPETPAADPSAPYSVQLQTDQTDGVEKWFLLDREGNLSEDGAAYAYGIEKIFEERAENAKTIESQKKKIKAARVWMIIFLILMIAGVAAAVYFFLRWRDQSDRAAFAEAERNRRNRGATRSGSGTGTGRPAQGSQGARTQSSSGGQQRQQASRNGTAQRPQGSPNGQRSAQGGAQRTANGQSRPQGSSQQGGNGSSRPQSGGSERSERVQEGQRSVQRPQQGEARQRSQGSAQGGDSRNGQSARGDREARSAERQSQQRAKSRNLADDDDEFEFGFLNWDDEDQS